MAREYCISTSNQTVSGAITLLGIRPGTTAAIEILRAWVSQSGSATSAQQRVQMVRQASTYPTVTAATPAKLTEGDPVSVITGGTALAAGTAGILATAEGLGAKTVIVDDAFNVVNGWLWVPTPREKIILSPSSASSFGLYLPAAPASTSGWSWGVVFGEVG